MLLVPVLLIIFSLSASAAVSFRGDWPNDGNSYRVEIYDLGQASPCDNESDNGTLLAGSGNIQGNDQFDSNDEYLLPLSLTSSGNLYIYFCNSADNTTLVSYVRNTTAGSNVELDFGKVVGTAATNNDLGSKYVHVCDALNGGTNIASSSALTAADGSYTQYYYLDEPSVATGGTNIPNLYIFFDNDNSNKCTFDATKIAGLHVIPSTQLPYNYGVNISYSPGTKLSSNAHADIMASGYLKVQRAAGDNEFVGMTGELTGGAGAYNLYYQNPATGTLTVYVYTGAVPDTTPEEIITGLANGASGNALDLSVRISGSVPSDVATVTTTIGGLTYNVSTIAGTPKTYNLYIPTGQAPAIAFKDAGGATLFTYNYGASVGSDDTLNVGKLYGNVHANLDGAGNTIQVFEDSACTANGSIESLAVVPHTANSPDYVAYFADGKNSTGPDYWVGINDSGYTICGNGFQLSSEERNMDFTSLITGTVSAGIYTAGAMALDADDDGVYSAGDPFTTHFDTSHNYELYVNSSGSHNILAFSTVAGGYPGTLELNISKTIAVDTTFNVGQVDWQAANVSADLTGASAVCGTGACWLSVYNGTSDVSSKTKTFAADGSQFYAVPAGTVDFQIWGDGGLVSYVSGYTPDADYRVTFEPGYNVTMTAPAGMIWAITGGGTFANYSSNAAGEQIYVDKSEEELPTTYTYSAYTTSPTTLRLSWGSKDASTDATWEVDKVSGASPAILDVSGSDTGDIQVASNLTACRAGTFVSSELVQPASGNYAQYYEGSAATYYVRARYAKAGTGNFDSCVKFSGSGGGASDTAGLVEVTGTVPSTSLGVKDLTEVGADNAELSGWTTANDSGDDATTLSFYSNVYHLVSLKDTAATTAHVRFYISGPGVALITQEDLALAGSSTTVNVDDIRGNVPALLDTAVLEGSTASGEICGGTPPIPGSKVAVATASDPGYRLYAKATGASFYVNFCDTNNTEGLGANTKLLEESVTTTSSGGHTFLLNVSRVGGAAHADLTDGDDPFSVYSGSGCTTPLSSETLYGLNPGTYAGSENYSQYYQTSGAGNYYLGVVEDGNTSCMRFSGGVAGSNDVVDITTKLSGTVPTAITKVAAANASGDGTIDAFTTDITAGAYALYIPSGSATSSALAYEGATLRLNRTKDLSVSDANFDVNEVHGDKSLLHSDIRGGTWYIEVWNTGGGKVSSETVDMGGGSGTYKQFYEDHLGYDIRIYNASHELAYYVYGYNPGVSGGDDLTFEPDTKLTTTAPTGIAAVEAIDKTRDDFTYRDNTSAPSNPYFTMYVANSTSYDLNAYTDSFTTLGLARTVALGTDKDLSGGDYEWIIGEITGNCANINSALKPAGGPGAMHVKVVDDYTNIGGWAEYSSQTVDLVTTCGTSPSYMQYYDESDVKNATNADIVFTISGSDYFVIKDYAPATNPDVMTLEPQYELTIVDPGPSDIQSAKFNLTAGALGTGTAAVEIVADGSANLVQLSSIYLPAKSGYTFHAYTATDLSGEVLERNSKAMAADDDWNIADVTGANASIHADLADGTHRIFVYANDDSTIVSGIQSGTQYATVGDYTLYYDVDDAGASAYIQVTTNTSALLTRYKYALPGLVGGDSLTFEPDTLLNVTYPASLNAGSFSYNDGTYNYYITAGENGGDTYVQSGSGYNFSAYTGAAWTTEVLRRAGKAVAPATTSWDIAEVTGNSTYLHPYLIGHQVKIYNNTDTGMVSGIEGGQQYVTIPAAGNNYTIYYDVGDADGSMYIHINSPALLLTRYHYNGPQFAGAGSLTFQPDTLINVTYPASMNNGSFKYTDSGGFDYLIKATENGTYVEADKSLYNFSAYSDAAWSALELNRTGKTVTAPTTPWNIADVYWNTTYVNGDLSGAAAQLEVYTTAGSLVSSETRTFDADDYQYYEVPDSGNVDFRVYDNPGAAVLFYAYNFTPSAAGNTMFEPYSPVVAHAPGTIHSWAIRGHNFTYRDNTTSLIIYVDYLEEYYNTDYIYKAYTGDFAGDVLSMGPKDASLNPHWYVNTVTNPYIHNDLVGSANLTVVYLNAGTDTDCDTATALSSPTDQIWANGIKKYYEGEGAGAKYVEIKVTNGSYVTCINTLGLEPVGGDQNTDYDLDVKTNGTVNSGIVTVYIDSNPTSNDDISQATVASGSVKLYNIYWAGASPADISYNDSTTKQLDLTGRNLTTNPTTINVGKVSGLSHPDMTTAQVYFDSACNTTQLSTETTGEPFNASGTPPYAYQRYFEDNGTQYLAVSDGVHTTCGTGGFTLSNEDATINMGRMVSGSTPSSTYDVVTWGGLPADADIVSIAANMSGGATNDFTTSPVSTGPAAPDDYVLFVDSDALGLSTTMLDFYANITPTGLVFDKAVDLSALDNVTNVAKVAGLADAGLWGGQFRVCDAIPSLADWGGCTTYLDSVPVMPANGSLATLDYDLFFEQPAVTDYYVELHSTGAYGGAPSYTYHLVSTTQSGDYIYQDFDGVVFGTVNETYNATVPIPNVEVNVYTGITDLVKAYTDAAGYYELYSGSSSGPMFIGEPAMPYGVAYNMSFQKAGYVTRDWNTDPNDTTDYSTPFVDSSSPLGDFGINGAAYPLAGAIGPDRLYLQLLSGIIVNVTDLGGNPINDATVSIYDCSFSSNPADCTTIGTCTNPPGGVLTGNCTLAAANNPDAYPGQYFFAGTTTPGDYVQIRVAKAPFDTQFDPDPNASVNNNIGGGGALQALVKTIRMINPAPKCSLEVTAPGGMSYQDRQYLVVANDSAVKFVVQCGEAGLDVTGDMSPLGGDPLVSFYPDYALGTVYNHWQGINASDDTYRLPINASDGVNTWQGLGYVEVDGTPPGIYDYYPHGGTFNTKSVTFGVWTDEIAVCHYDTNPNDIFWNMSYTMAGDGSQHTGMVYADNGANTVYVRCADRLGNAMNTSQEISFNVDAVAPSVTNVSPAYLIKPYNATNRGNVSIMTDMDADCRWDAAEMNYTNMPLNHSFNTTGGHWANLANATPGQGLNMFFIRCRSKGGSAIEMSSSALLAFNYDTIQPTIYGLGWYLDDGAQKMYLDFASDEPLDLSSLALTFNNTPMTHDGGNGMNFVYSFNYSALPDGTYEVNMTSCKDLAGNICVQSGVLLGEFPFDVTIDRAAPAISGVGYNASTWNLTATTNESATCKWSWANEDYWDMPNAMTGSGTGHFALVPLPEGSYNIYIKCADGSYNVGNYTYSVSVDTMPPVITASSPTGVIATSSPTLNVTTNEASICRYATSAFNYDAGGILMDNTTSGLVHTKPLSGLNDSTYLYYVLCRDAAGNTMASPLPITFVIDTRGNFNYTYDLSVGWNNFFLPRIVLQNFTSLGGNYTVKNVLETKGGLTNTSYNMLYYRNATSCPAQNGSCWRSYVPGDTANDLTEFNDWDNLPYWIHMLLADRLEIP